MTWSQVAAGAKGALTSCGDIKGNGTLFPFGAHVAMVELDRDSGKPKILKYFSIDDAGFLVNPLLVQGQVHGGLAQGLEIGAVVGHVDPELVADVEEQFRDRQRVQAQLFQGGVRADGVGFDVVLVGQDFLKISERAHVDTSILARRGVGPLAGIIFSTISSLPDQSRPEVASERTDRVSCWYLQPSNRPPPCSQYFSPTNLKG